MTSAAWCALYALTPVFSRPQASSRTRGYLKNDALRCNAAEKALALSTDSL
jgi:hypothetical protein